MDGLWRDTIGFAGMKMIRRIVGIAHVADLEDISDTNVRATCEKRAVLLAREMVLYGAGMSDVMGGGLDTLLERATELAGVADAQLTYPNKT